MKANYKPIGKYIRLVDERNIGLAITTLLGISISKVFISSVANTIGSDMENYKIIRKNQFSCSLMQVSRDKKIPIAILKDYDEAIISQAYPVFEVVDENKLLPEYLMMWFSRAEFDREACFYAVGGVRGSLPWEDFCDLELPIPSIEKQKEIVAEYNTIVNRIKLNEQLNQKLEETAQAIYKRWFVDFEFPDENGNPYKSSGGEMVWNEELDQEIPVGWGSDLISALCTIGSSRRIFFSEYVEKGVPFYRGGEIVAKKEGKPITNPLYISRKRFVEIATKNDIPQAGDILLTAVGTIGVSYLVNDEEFYFKDGNLIWFRGFKERTGNLYLYDYMQSRQFKKMLDEITIGSTQNAITIATIGEQHILKPNQRTVSMYCNYSKALNSKLGVKKSANETLLRLKDLLLSKMTKAEAAA
jgi:type I restriction enzyme, S subunit